jgi:hypothetical protein
MPPLYDPGSQPSASSLHRQRDPSARAGIIDAERLRSNLDAYEPIARLFGNLYARLGEKLVLKRQSFTEWQAENGVGTAADGVETKS